MTRVLDLEQLARAHRIDDTLDLRRRAVLRADLDLRVRGEQRGEVGREVLGDVLARALVADASPARELERRLVAMHEADAERRVDGRVVQARVSSVRQVPGRDMICCSLRSRQISSRT